MTSEQYFNDLRLQNLEYAKKNFSQISFVGLDMSLQSTGYAVIRNGKYIEGGQIGSKVYGAERLHEIASNLIRIIERYPSTFVSIENYAFNPRNSSSITGLAELGGVIRTYLHLRKRCFLTVAPTTVKKYIMGNGQAPKNLMAMKVLKKFNIEVIGDDHADAIGIAFYAYHSIRYALNTELNYTQIEKECFDVLLSMKKKKQKKKTNKQLALEIGHE